MLLACVRRSDRPKPNAEADCTPSRSREGPTSCVLLRIALQTEQNQSPSPGGQRACLGKRRRRQIESNWLMVRERCGRGISTNGLLPCACDGELPASAIERSNTLRCARHVLKEASFAESVGRGNADRLAFPRLFSGMRRIWRPPFVVLEIEGGRGNPPVEPEPSLRPVSLPTNSAEDPERNSGDGRIIRVCQLCRNPLRHGHELTPQ